MPAPHASSSTSYSRPAAHAAGPPTWLPDAQRRAESALNEYLASLQPHFGSHSRLGDAVLYSVRVGGKRLRPVLVLEACRLTGGHESAALPAAIALELIHTFSLIHDDLPAMDNDDLRRGQPTNHKVFGEALAILAGDWLSAHALRLAASGADDPARGRRLADVLADGTLRMIAGQAADIAGEQRPVDPELVGYIHAHKTAALIETACRLGAVSAGASEADETALAQFGHHLGLAFQIVDDLLDATGTPENLGKAVRKDADSSKQTFPAAYGLEESRRRAEHELAAACAALDAFGPRADRLRELADYVVSRDR